MKTASHAFLYSKKFDFPPFTGDIGPVICMFFIPRSGSTLLACLMQQTMLLGFPLEYFGKLNIDILSQRITDYSINNINPLLYFRTSQNGIFSFKLNTNFPISKSTGLLNHLKVSHFIYVDRNDLDAQASSYAIASRTDQWVQAKESSQNKFIEASTNQVLSAKAFLNDQRNLINNFLVQRPEPVLRTTYESIISDPQMVIDSIGKLTGVKVNTLVNLENVPIKKQS